MARVREYMTRGVYTVDVNATLGDVVRVMARYRISGVAVVGEDGDTLGVVSDTDVLNAIVEGRDPKTTRVSEVMMPFTLIVDEEASIEEAAQIMERERVHRLFVVREEKPEKASLSKPYLQRPVGIITSSDIVRYMAE
ncbi:MAG: CBS domain-containing protein [Euryarchaeota archaeon]|nr:CBS domain-containing protein [Euryarchaeota archaeon]